MTHPRNDTGVQLAKSGLIRIAVVTIRVILSGVKCRGNAFASSGAILWTRLCMSFLLWSRFCISPDLLVFTIVTLFSLQNPSLSV
jgi:hypothetical protein